MSYPAIEEEPLRVVKLNNNANLFYSSVKPLMFGMIKQGAHSDKLLNIFKNYLLTDIRFYFQCKARDTLEHLSLMFQ